MRHLEYNEARFAKVLQHLHQHYPHDIALARLADIACLSPYHWHRLYRAVLGETIYETLKRIRLHHAARLLLDSHKPLPDIARACGYGGNAQSFARIFRDAYGMSPQDYRARGGVPYPALPPERTTATYPVKIRDIAALPVVALPHHGDYMSIGASFSQLETLLTLRGHLPAPQARYFGIYYDDPAGCPTAQLRAAAAVVKGRHKAEGVRVMVVPGSARVRLQAEAEGLDKIFTDFGAEWRNAGCSMCLGMNPDTMDAGRYAVLEHRGAYAELHRAYDWLYRDWLLNSPYQLADAPCLEEYLNDWQQVPPQELRTNIYLPLI